MVNTDVRWSSVDDYAYSFTAQIAPMLNPGDPLLLTCLAGDLDEHHSRRLSGQMLYEEVSSVQPEWSAWQQIQVPTWLLTAEWGTGQGTKPAYPPETIQRIQRQVNTVLTVSVLQGADHAVAVMSMTGAKAVASLIDKALESSA